MGRRRKSQDAAGGFLLLLALAVAAAIFLVRLVATVVFYAAVPSLVIAWLTTLKLRKTISLGKPEEFDDKSSWHKISALQAKRQRLFSDLHDKYTIGFENGLAVTAKSNDKLFHAGSKLGKRLNLDLENIYCELNSVMIEIAILRRNVLYKIPDWRAFFDAQIKSRRIHIVSAALSVILLISSAAFHLFSLLSQEFIDEAAKILLWNPDPEHIGGDLVVACGATMVSALFIWPMTNKQNLDAVELENYREWQSLEEKWSKELEHAEFSFDPSRFQESQQETPHSGDHASDSPWFEILSVSEYATPEEIKRAYREAIRQYHPDKVSNLGERLRKVAEEESKLINAAFSEAKRKRGFA